jgi:perosamine synthetase
MADPFFTEEDRLRIHREIDVILTEALSMGPNVNAFEQEFAQLVGVRHAIAMNSCTSALEIALHGLGVSEGDEVIVPCETFIATGMAVHLVGGRPVFGEISAQTFCLDPEDIEKRITPKTRGVITVYMSGLIPGDIFTMKKLCDKHGLFLVEDAAHAPGACRDGKVAGSIGHAGCFSFFPTKIITSGEGGMLTTDDDRLAAFARSLQHRGRDLSSATEQYSHSGRNVRMTEMAALLGRVQLGHLAEYLAERRRVAAIYKSAFVNDNRVRLIVPDDDSASAFWKFPLLLADGIDRSRVTTELHKAGVFADWSYWPALHLQPVFRDLYGMKEGDLPKSEGLLSRHICLPCHPRISNDDAEYVAGNLKLILDRFGARPG